ncbi:Phage tail fiber protein [Acinetobacter bereziniae]|uniref:phage tail-collar fiber domain-containing protein n=1 Tax=Acinetobacter bereziniae TaxID=106648 RepID=UPI0005757515|nr:phage tail protein [Acinetobacter bereziniae]CEI51549.1 Phage tail fiber protein [Acinetobacter bereziniae]
MATVYKGILTNNGKALIANATVNNKVNYSHIALGDGNGSVPTPSETRPALINEKARIALNVVEISSSNANQIVCEAIIPSNVGGFYIRELGLYAGATMVVNSNYPPTYKPLADEGGAREINLKLIINVQNAEVIALYLDDSLIYATREWVNTNYIRRNEIVDNLTTDDSKKPLSAKQGKTLQDNKLDKNANAVSATKLKDSRKINSVDFDGTKDISITAPMRELTATHPDNALDDGFYICAGVNIAGLYTYGILETRNGNGGNVINQTYTAHLGGAFRVAVRQSWDGGRGFSEWIIVGYKSSTAYKLENIRTVSFSGAATGAFNYDGSADSSCILTLSNSGVVAGTYASTVQIPSITVNDKGLITGISQQTIRSASVTQTGIVQLVDDLVSDDATKALTAKQGKILQDNKLNRAITIPENADLNNYQAQGSFLVNFNVIAETLKNCPTKKAFSLQVDINAGCVQRLTTYKDGGMLQYIRSYYDGGWSPWYKTYSELDPQPTVVEAKQLNTELTTFTDDQDFIRHYSGKSKAFFDNGSGKFFTQYSSGLVSSLGEGGTFFIACDVLTGKTKIISCVVRANGTIDNLFKKELAYTDNQTFTGTNKFTGDIKVDGPVYAQNFRNDGDFWFVSKDGSTAKRLLTGGLLVSDAYVNADQIPSLGIYSKGSILTSGGFSSTRAETTIGNSTGRYLFINQQKWGAFDPATGYVPLSVDCGGTGNGQGIAPSATKLQIARKINDVSFDGTGDINIPPVSFYIPAGANLNNYQSTGFFFQDADVAAQQIANVPVQNAFALRVERSAGCSQWFTPYNGSGVTYFRHYYSGNWSNWIVLKPNNVTLSGQLSGSASFDNYGNVNISASVLGIDQTWRNVTSQRAANTTYTNNRPVQIKFAIYLEAGGNNAYANISVAGEFLFAFSNTTAWGTSRGSEITVPPYATYRVDGTFTKWSELT